MFTYIIHNITTTLYASICHLYYRSQFNTCIPAVPVHPNYHCTSSLCLYISTIPICNHFTLAPKSCSYTSELIFHHFHVSFLTFLIASTFAQVPHTTSELHFLQPFNHGGEAVYVTKQLERCGQRGVQPHVPRPAWSTICFKAILASNLNSSFNMSSIVSISQFAKSPEQTMAFL